MSEPVVQFASAASYTLDHIAQLLTQSFEGYLYPVQQSSLELAARVRFEQIDLYRSTVLLIDQEHAGLAALAVRGERAWCAGFGIVPAFRGAGHARGLMAEHLYQAKLAGCTRFGLEVLTRNTRAIATYKRAGLQIDRDLLLFDWHGEIAAGYVDAQVTWHGVVPRSAARAAYAHLHGAPAAWQRDDLTQRMRPQCELVTLSADDKVIAYALVAVKDLAARIQDFAASGADAGARLLRAIQARYTDVISMNEPVDSPATEAYTRCGFREFDRQHEMSAAIL